MAALNATSTVVVLNKVYYNYSQIDEYLFDQYYLRYLTTSCTCTYGHLYGYLKSKSMHKTEDAMPFV